MVVHDVIYYIVGYLLTWQREFSWRGAQSGSRPASTWVEMKCLKIKLPDHFSVHVTNEKWPKDCCNNWDSHFYKISLNRYLHWHENEFIKKKLKDVITTLIANRIASMIYRDNQNKYVWGKDRQEDLMEIFNESIDYIWQCEFSW